MSPARRAGGFRGIAAYIRKQRLHGRAAELAVQGLDPLRDEIVFSGQVEAVSELLQAIAQNLDEYAAGIIFDAKEEERVA